MIDIEKLKSAKFFVDYLANGRNPFGGEELPTDDIVNDVRSARWLFYISGVLEEIIQNGAPTPAPSATRIGKVAFYLTDEMKSNFAYSKAPITISEIVRRIVEIGPTDNVKKFPKAKLSKWLISIGVIEEFLNKNGRISKKPSKLGSEMGITQELRAYNGKFYYIILYNEDAQRFIIDNLDAVFAFDTRAFNAERAARIAALKDNSGEDTYEGHDEDSYDEVIEDNNGDESVDGDGATDAVDTATAPPSPTPVSENAELSCRDCRFSKGEDCFPGDICIDFAPKFPEDDDDDYDYEPNVTDCPASAPSTSSASEKAEPTCLDCKFSRSGECFPQKRICADFELAYTVDEDERDAWPDYGDATALKRGEKR